MRSLLGVEILLPEVGQSVDGLLGALAPGAQRDRVALADPQGHQQERAGGLNGGAAALLDGDGPGCAKILVGRA